MLYFANNLRNQIIDVVTAGALGAQGLFHWSITALRNAWTNISPRVRRIRRILFLFTALWFLTVIGLGIYGNALGSSIVIAIVFPVWCILLILSPLIVASACGAGRIRTSFCNIFRIVNIPTTVLLIIFGLPFLIGMCSPEFNTSLWRYIGNKTLEGSNSLNKGSLNSEPESGIFGTVSENTTLYNDNNSPFKKIERGMFVRVLDLEGKKANRESEGLTYVMTPNEDGDFIKGSRGYIPSRKVNWDRKESTASVKPSEPDRNVVFNINVQQPAQQQVATFAPAPRVSTPEISGRWELSWGDDGILDVDTSIQNNELLMVGHYNDGRSTIFKGTRYDINSPFEGNWIMEKNDRTFSGDFSIKFIDKLATGQLATVHRGNVYSLKGKKI
ncbi:MAG: hypothetical protein COU40_00535 [Candidatus Moranbacteria bacterium CG10_big_fil_rev_8_21_14_0_10_35_21]|nr:MAG: hypothetical protein COU40_00535 [Candidatus Moranbacteria bacterium CG10_big_fil_rev_8_21_14_0_10_35_21]